MLDPDLPYTVISQTSNTLFFRYQSPNWRVNFFKTVGTVKIILELIRENLHILF